MWYHLYNQQSQIFRAIGEHLKSNHTMFDAIFSKKMFPLASRNVSASSEALHRMFKEYPKPEFGIKNVYIDDDTTLDVIQTTLLDLPFVRLLKFTKVNGKMTDSMSDCLIVAPLSGHYATLLRDTVKSMLAHCDAVYITDWKNARDVPVSEGIFDLSMYVHNIEACMDHIGKRVHVMAVCQPVVPVLMSASRRHAHPNRPLTMTLIGGPIDARKSPTTVNNYATEHDLQWFKSKVIDNVPMGYAGVGRRVYPGFLQHFGFVAMNPRKHANAYNDFYKNLLKGDNSSTDKHRVFYDEYNAVLDLDAAYYLETVEEVFQKFSLAKGEMMMDGELIVPASINDIALLTIEGEKDDIAGVGQTRAAHDLCPNIPQELSKHWEVQGVGHYGVFSGTTFRTKISPEIAKWQQEQSAMSAPKETLDEVSNPEAALNTTNQKTKPVEIEVPARKIGKTNAKQKVLTKHKAANAGVKDSTRDKSGQSPASRKVATKMKRKTQAENKKKRGEQA